MLARRRVNQGAIGARNAIAHFSSLAGSGGWLRIHSTFPPQPGSEPGPPSGGSSPAAKCSGSRKPWDPLGWDPCTWLLAENFLGWRRAPRPGPAAGTSPARWPSSRPPTPQRPPAARPSAPAVTSPLRRRREGKQAETSAALRIPHPTPGRAGGHEKQPPSCRYLERLKRRKQFLATERKLLTRFCWALHTPAKVVTS